MLFQNAREDVYKRQALTDGRRLLNEPNKNTPFAVAVGFAAGNAGGTLGNLGLRDSGRRRPMAFRRRLVYRETKEARKVYRLRRMYGLFGDERVPEVQRKGYAGTRNARRRG